MQQNQINYDQIVEQIRSQLDLVDIARELGIEIKKTGQNYRSKSFLTDGGNETCVSYKFNGSNLWHDFKTEDTGDVIQLYAHMKCGGDRKLAFRELMERCNISPNNKNFVRDSEFVQDKRYFLNLVNSWHQSLEQEHREYLHSRGITDETIDTLKIGYNAHQNRIMIPYYLEEDKRHNSPVYACGRLFVKECNPSEKYHKWSLKKIIGTDSKTGENIFAPNKYLQNVIWGLDTLDRNKDNILIICEGAFDALSFWQEGYAVISPLTTSFNKSQKEELPKIMSRFHEVMIILDNDDSGQQKAYTLAKLCFDNHIEFSISSVKETESFFTKTGENVVVDGLKDVSDFYSNAITQLDIFSEMNKEETNKEKDKQDIKENKALEETDNKSTKVPISHNLLKPLIDRRKNGLTYLCQKEVDFYPNYGKRYDEIEKILMVACRYYPDRYVRLPVEYFNKQLKYYRFTLKEKDSIKEEINSLEKDKSNEKEEAELARLEVLINSKSDELKEKNKSIKKLKRRILQEEEIRDLEQLVKKGPKDSVLINEILNQHLLLFDSASGFFEFNGLCWNNKPDHYILHIIGEHLGKFNKGRHSTDILKALQGSCHKTVNFNSKEIIAFKNCVLDLQSGFTTKEGNPEDYVTYQLDFDYDPEANCPQWIRFIADVSDSDEGRKQLLKEVGGYTLFSHSKLHKCIYLIGSGSNGKSLYLNMVSNVFGSENITHVPLSELDNEFKRVSFRTALLNISPDDTGTLPRSCRGIFKNIITEDPIDGAKKHKDSLNFRPRVKVMIASEHLPKTNDIGYGMDRRFLFIEFPTTFVRHPKTPNEKELDPNLEEKLKKEIPGIFNFFYEGYKELRKNMTFTETSLEAQLHDRFKKKNNIVLEFLHDVDLTHLNEISNKDAYKKFIEWCYSADYDEVPLSQKSFSRSFRSEFIKLHPDYREYNTSGHRGVKKKEPEQLQMI